MYVYYYEIEIIYKLTENTPIESPKSYDNFYSELDKSNYPIDLEILVEVKNHDY